MSDNTLQQKFDEMALAVRNATIDFSPNNTQKLKLYAFYKQATEGDVVGECPSIINMIERAKWQAWNAIKGMEHVAAMEGYLKIFDSK
jgi:3-hydroxyacyl-CoA dehydrogenase